MTVLVIAPHPDDETLGCGGTLLRHAAAGEPIHWLIVTAMTEDAGWPREKIANRAAEIERVSAAYGFAQTHQLALPAAGLDALPLSHIIQKISGIVATVQPTAVYLPFPRDAHTDHRIVFEAGSACVKTFRYPSVTRVLAYETVSETDFGMDPSRRPFEPNHFVDTAAYLEQKLQIMKLFAGEMGDFPFPRSETIIRAQAALRGAQAGCAAAEAFVLIKEIIR